MLIETLDSRLVQDMERLPEYDRVMPVIGQSYRAENVRPSVQLNRVPAHWSPVVNAIVPQDPLLRVIESRISEPLHRPLQL